MTIRETLGIQAARRALADLRIGSDDALAKDRLDRIETLLERVAANLGRRAGFEAEQGLPPEEMAAAIPWSNRFIQRWEAEVAAFDPRYPTGQGGDEGLAGRLHAYLSARFPDESELAVMSVRRLPGGRSKQTLIVELEGSGVLTSPLVLRTDSSRTTAHDSVAREYPLIVAIHAAGCPTPCPLWFESDIGVVGAAFIAFAYVAGEPAGTLWETFDQNGNAARELARALAQLHRVPVGAVPNGRDAPARIAVAALFASYEARWLAARPEPSLIIAQAFAWLNARLDRLAGAAVIVHGDAHFSNMLMQDGKLACLLDWEFWHFGHPAEDLAYCRPYVEATLGWDDFVTAYRDSGGPMIENAALDLFAVWRPLRNAVLAAGVAHDFVAKQDLDLETATIALATYPRMEAQVAAVLAAALNPAG